MRDRRNAYGPYRGRRTLHDVLRAIAIVLAVLVALAVAVLVWGQNYIVYTDDGIRFNPPAWLQAFREKGDGEPAESGEINLVVRPPDESREEPEPFVPVVVPMTLEQAVGEQREALLEQAGGNAVLLEVKGSGGKLLFRSEQALALEMGANPEDPSVNGQLEQLNAREDVYTVARLCCFADETLGSSHSYAILTNSGYRWTDPAGIHWVSPTNQQVRDYLVGLMTELARLGFDEILLTHCGYPDEGNLHYIKKGEAYRQEDFPTVMESLLSQAAQALADYPVKLSLQVERATLAGEEELTGVSPGLLEKYAQGIWLEGLGEEEALETARQAGISRPEQRLTLWSAALSPQAQTAQALRTGQDETTE